MVSEVSSSFSQYLWWDLNKHLCYVYTVSSKKFVMSQVFNWVTARLLEDKFLVQFRFYIILLKFCHKLRELWKKCVEWLSSRKISQPSFVFSLFPHNWVFNDLDTCELNVYKVLKGMLLILIGLDFSHFQYFTSMLNHRFLLLHFVHY